jgi:hypothetical protein
MTTKDPAERLKVARYTASLYTQANSDVDNGQLFWALMTALDAHDALRAEVESLKKEFDDFHAGYRQARDAEVQRLCSKIERLRAALEAFVNLEAHRPWEVEGQLVCLMDNAREALRRE